LRNISIEVCRGEGFSYLAHRVRRGNALSGVCLLNSAAMFSRRSAIGQIVIALSTVVVMTAGCTSLPKQAGAPIPVVTLSETPPAVRTTVLGVARGRRIEKINRVGRAEGLLYRAYIADKLGPELLAVDDSGKIVDDAVVIPFAEMPEAVRKSTQTAVTGSKLQVCRKSIHSPETMYVIDYLIGDDEPVFALIDGTGVVHAVFGYAEGDPD
jgi:hypothetical protein